MRPKFQKKLWDKKTIFKIGGQNFFLKGSKCI